MDDLSGSAADRVAQLDAALHGGVVEPEWLVRQLRIALDELRAIEPIADAEMDRREDY